MTTRDSALMMKSILLTLVALLVVSTARAAPEPEPIAARIAFLSDTHVNLQTNEPGLSYIRRLDQAIAAVNAAKVDLVLIAGDLTDGGTGEQMAMFKRKARRLKAPVLFVAGNHDVGIVGNGTVKTSITHDRVKLFGKRLGPSWFVREKAGLRIIGINSCLFLIGEQISKGGRK